MLRRTLILRSASRTFSTSPWPTAETYSGRLRLWTTPLERHLSLHKHVTPTFALLNHGNASQNGIQCTQNRFFFFGSGNDNNDNDDTKGKSDKETKGDDKNAENEEETPEGEKSEKEDDSKRDDEKDDEGTSSIDPEPSPSLNNSSKYKRPTRSTISLGNSTPSNVLLPAHRLGFGDQAPRYPHLLALPVVRGPVFPGVLVRV